MNLYAPGDLIVFEADNNTHYGELLNVDDNGKFEISCIKKTKKQGGRIWEFVADDEWDAVDPSSVKKHISIGDPTRDNVKKAWKEIGFYPAGDGITFCRVEDQDSVTMPLYAGAEDDSEDETDPEGLVPSTKPNMHGYASDDGFVVPDDEGEEFEFANPDELDEEAAAFVRDTHKAVRDFDNWAPTDKKAIAIKKYIENMDRKATIQEDNRRFRLGKPALPMSKPPMGEPKIGKRKRDT